MTLAQQSGSPAAIAVLPALAEPDSAGEVNHRLANSLQLLAALVSVEARRIVDPVARAALDTTLRRIGAIANVHRQLYRGATSSRIDLAAYLETLAADLEQGVGGGWAGRRVLVAAEAREVGAEDAMSIGILVSELVSNACKYAYAADEPGDIHVLLEALPLGGYQLDVADRGRGLPAGAAPQGTGLGGRLIAMMANRLGGEPGWHDAGPGTRFTLRVAKL